MNSIERISKAISFEDQDRVPVIVLSRQVLMRLEGLGYGRDSLFHTAAILEAEIHGWNRFGYDMVSGRVYYPLEEEIFGACIQESPHSFPSVCAPYVVNTPADLDKIKTDQLLGHENFLVERKLLAGLFREVGDRVPVLGYCQGPLRLAGQLRGLEPMMMDMMGDKKFLHALLEKTTEISLFRAQSAILGGATLLFIGEPAASGNLISPALYEEFGLPYHRKLISSIKELGDVPVILHICGDTSKMIASTCQSGADILHVEQVNLRDAKGKAGKPICFLGNIDPVNVMLRGDIHEVRQAALDCLSEMKDDPGFILGPGCSIPGETPPENIQALMEAANQ